MARTAANFKRKRDGSFVARKKSRPSEATTRAVKAAMSLLGEKKFVDTTSSPVFDTTGTIKLLATVPVGPGANERIGKKINWKSLQVRGRILAGSTGTVADPSLLIVYDKRPTGTLPAITDILESAQSKALNNAQNENRFRILRRFDWAMAGNSTTPATGTEVVSADFFLPLKGLVAEYKSALSTGTGAIADIDTGALYLVTVGSNGAGTAAPSGDLTFRVRYEDM